MKTKRKLDLLEIVVYSWFLCLFCLLLVCTIGIIVDTF